MRWVMLSHADGRVVLGAAALALIAAGLKLLIPPPQPLPMPERAFAPEPHPIDLNRASMAELMELPGIGPLLAERIIRYRLVHGPFRSLDELLNVPGIGPRTLERLRAYVRVCAGRCD